MPGKNLEEARVNPLKHHQKFVVDEVIVVPAGGNFAVKRMQKIAGVIDQLHEKEHIIVIDELLGPEDESALKLYKGKAWAQHVRVFNKWGEGVYQSVTHELLKLREPSSEKKILHISLDGIRGVDYRLGAPAHVVAAYNVPNITMLRQGGGRGARLFTDTCKLTLIICSTSMLASIKADQIETYLSNNELTLSAADSLKRAVLDEIDGKVPVR